MTAWAILVNRRPVRLPLQLAAIGLAGFLLGRLFVNVPARTQAAQNSAGDRRVEVAGAPLAHFNDSDVQSTPGQTAPIAQKLKSAAAEKDQFKRAEFLVAVLDTMTAEDFRALGIDGIVSALEDPTSEYHSYLGTLDPFVRRWLELDRDEAVRTILSTPEDPKWFVLAKVDPEAVIEHCLTDPSILGRSLYVRVAFESLAMRDTRAARRFLERVPDPKIRKEMEDRIARGIAASDPITAMARARELNSESVFVAAVDSARKMGPGVVRQVLEMNAGKFGMERHDLAFRYPDIDWDSMLSPVEFDQPIEPNAFRVALRMDATERAAFLERLQSSSGATANATIAGVVAAWAAREPKAAADWAMTRAKQDDADDKANHAIREAIQFWVAGDKAGALQWLSDLPDSELQRDLRVQAAERLRWDEESSAIKGLVPVQLREGDSHRISEIESWNYRQNPEAIAEWLIGLSPAGVSNATANSVMRKWIEKDPDNAAQWAEELPRGQRRDQFVLGIVKAVSEKDSTAAADWIETIEAPDFRRWAIRAVFTAIQGRDKAEALAWIRSRSDLDPRYRDAIVRSAR